MTGGIQEGGSNIPTSFDVHLEADETVAEEAASEIDRWGKSDKERGKSSVSKHENANSTYAATKVGDLDNPELEEPLPGRTGEPPDPAGLLNDNPEMGKWFKSTALMAFFEAMLIVAKMTSRIKEANSELSVSMGQARFDNAKEAMSLNMAAAELDKKMAIFEMAGHIVSAVGSAVGAVGSLAVGAKMRKDPSKAKAKKAEKEIDHLQAKSKATGNPPLATLKKPLNTDKNIPPGDEVAQLKDLKTLKKQGRLNGRKNADKRKKLDELDARDRYDKAVRKRDQAVEELNDPAHADKMKSRREMAPQYMQVANSMGSAISSLGNAMGPLGKVLFIVDKVRNEELAKIASIISQGFGELKTQITGEEQEWDKLLDSMTQAFDQMAQSTTQNTHFNV